MANTKSAKKSIRVNKRNTLINKVYKTRIKTTQKKLLQNLQGAGTNIESKSIAEYQDLLSSYYKRIDLAVKKNLLHKNKAARKKSQMAKKIVQLKN